MTWPCAFLDKRETRRRRNDDGGVVRHQRLEASSNGGPDGAKAFDLISGHGGGAGEAFADIGGKSRLVGGDPGTEALPDFGALQARDSIPNKAHSSPSKTGLLRERPKLSAFASSSRRERRCRQAQRRRGQSNSFVIGTDVISRQECRANIRQQFERRARTIRPYRKMARTARRRRARLRRGSDENRTGRGNSPARGPTRRCRCRARNRRVRRLLPRPTRLRSRQEADRGTPDYQAVVVNVTAFKAESKLVSDRFANQRSASGKRFFDDRS